MRMDTFFRTVLRHRWTPAFFIAALFFLVYFRSLPYPFLNYDDSVYLYENPLVTDFSLAKLPVVFSTDQLANFSPMVTLSFALEHKFWGLNPAGYRLVSFLLHAGSIVLLYLLLLRLFSSPFLSAATTLLFAVHPLRIEALVWVSSRKDTLFGFFLLLSLNLYLNYLRKKKNGFYIFSLLAVCIALLAKVTAMIALPLLLLIDWWERRKFGRDMIVDKLPFVLVILLLGLTNTSLLLSSKFGTYLGWAQLPPIAAGTLAFLVGRFFWPFGLAVRYPAVMAELNEPLWLCLVLMALFFLATGWILHWRRIWVFGLSFTVITLFPVWMFMLRNYPMADRFTYLPSIGVGLLTVASVGQSVGKWTNRRLRTGLIVVLSGIMLSVLVIAHKRYLPIWRDNMTLWTDVIEKYPQTHLAYNNRSVLLRREGKYELAIQDLNRAIALYPGFADAYWNRGVCYSCLKQIEQSEINFLNAVLFDPDYLQKLVALAHTDQIQNGFALSIRAGRMLEDRGMTWGPQFFYIMAYLNTREKHWPEAERYISAALKDDPGNTVYRELESRIRKRFLD